MVTVKLEFAEWKYDPDQQIGREGGFGTVFRGVDGDGHPVAVKKLKIEARDAAHRELAIAKDLRDRDLTHVIPVLDSGQDADSDSYFVVMALAEKSLQDELHAGNTFDDVQAATIMTDIAAGLSEVPDIVHRDLKPDNVLYHEARWKVADFGIARFVEDSTSTQTLKGYLTDEYAAPEQWRLEHATTATDVYALGCIGYALLTGRPPFKGPDRHHLRQQHLSEAPPSMDDHSRQFVSLLLMMLRKHPRSRPTLDRVMTLLKQVRTPDTGVLTQKAFAGLAEAGVKVATRQAEQEARAQVAQAEFERRKLLASEAQDLLTDIFTRLGDNISKAAPAANISENAINLGQARLEIEHMAMAMPKYMPRAPLPKSKWDVVYGVVIAVKQNEPPCEWSASLWYSRLPTDDNYRWREVSYFATPTAKKKHEHEPFAITELQHADQAAAPTAGPYQIAFGPKAIDDEDFEDFCNRWADRLAKAAHGKLCRPARLPLQ